MIQCPAWVNDVLVSLHGDHQGSPALPGSRLGWIDLSEWINRYAGHVC